MKQLTQSVLITGACGHLGRAVAEAFEARGARVALLDRDAAQLASAFGAQTPHRLLLAADLGDAKAVQAACSQAGQHFGGIDVLCNLAGGFRMGEAVHETSDETWDFLLGLNARSLLFTARAVVPGMLQRGSGCIVNVGAAAAARGGEGMGAYAASKSAVARLTESMSAELRDRGVRVNCVLPSILDTPVNRQDMPRADFGRWVSPAALAEVVAFLASDGAGPIHGACIPVTGLV